jgi:predicted pyridoxine 5'-phosphate oxidase superfamily flavin-nucleotide-binding protein
MGNSAQAVSVDLVVTEVATGFHSGELAVQRRAGVQQQAARLSTMVARGELRGGIAGFLANARFAAITGRDASGRLWTSPVVGPPGFLKAASPTTLVIGTAPQADDPLHGVPAGQPVGLIVMDFAARRRLRINGRLSAAGTELTIDVAQAYGNCPQYIHPRSPSPNEQTQEARLIHSGNALQPDDVDQVQSSDTFFLGTTHPEFGNDASHRGGPAGFVQADAHGLSWPDFPGNNMFNSLGNLAVDPAAALLFIDFATGRTIQLSGAAAVQWLDDERSVQFDVHEVVVTSVPALMAN